MNTTFNTTHREDTLLMLLLLLAVPILIMLVMWYYGVKTEESILYVAEEQNCIIIARLYKQDTVDLYCKNGEVVVYLKFHKRFNYEAITTFN